MQGEQLSRLGDELGLDAVGAASVAPYEETERHILERRARGLFADMRFTMARPEVSCHPETLLEGARTVVSAALCYWLEGEEPPPGHGRLPRYTWWDAYAALRERLDELGRRLGGEYRVLVDANQHVDREAAARSGVGFYGKNTMLITRRHGSWVVLGTLVTTAELEATPALDAGCGSCTLCIDACPTDALAEAGVLDATRCLSYWTQSADPMPEEIREALGDRVYGCDICQDVCPWNRGVEGRRAGETHEGAEPHVSLADWLQADDDELAARYDRLFVPHNDPRYLRRNALVALGNAGGDPALAEPFAEGDDPLLREHAEWALERLPVNGELRRLRDVERWIGWVRLGAVPFAIFQVAIGEHYPRHYELWAWITTGIFAVGALAFFALSRREWSKTALKRIGLAALTFDFAIASTYTLIYSFEQASPVRQVMYLPLVEAALRYGIVGALALTAASAPVMAGYEWLRSDRFAPHRYHVDYVTLQLGLEVLLGLIVGWLMLRLLGQSTVAETRAVEAEKLRDQLGRRADVLESANRCARALSSSLELDRAFDAFIREVRGLLPFDRIAIVLSENGVAQVMAVAGAGADDVLPPGSGRPIHGTLLEELLRTNQTVYRRDMSSADYPEEDEFLALGLHCRLATPLLQGARSIGMLSLVRKEPDAFSPDDIELAGLLGRLVASAVQNIRAYESERKTVDELRRLSALRADFVSLVSHELRTPMAAVIGAARTLQQRWRELSPDQRESFLELIAGETNRLAELIGDVLDTSRIEAGTFSFRFQEVDLGQLVHDTVSNAQLGQDEVRLRADVQSPLPEIRGDHDRLRQVLTNLIDNAIKYSPAEGEVEVRAYQENGRVLVDVRDRGPGIAKADQKLIFEKFGRVTGGGATRPGTGLGLFIARSIAEAHGGGLEVQSAPEQGATFTLELPLAG